MSVLSRTAIVSGATLASRVLGFARDAATAALLGAGPLADALTAALALPLLARRLLSEGAFNLAMVPALARAKGGERALSNGAIAALLILLTLLAGLAAFFMPALIGLLSPGFAAEGERAAVAILCGRIAIFYLPLAGLAAVYGAVANADHRVLLPALAPAIANLTVLCAITALFLRGHLDSATSAYVIAAATLVAGLAQWAVMALAARGAPAAPGPGPADFAGARAVLRAASPALLFAGLSQFRLIIIAALVSSAPGAVAALNYAQRLVDLPLGLVGASAGAVLVPALLAHKDEAGAGARAVLAALAFALPAAVGLLVLAEPIITVLFERGSFDADDTRLTATLLLAVALALPAQGLERILSALAAAGGLIAQAERIALASLGLCLLCGLALSYAAGPLAAPFAMAVSSLFACLLMGALLIARGRLRVDWAVLLTGAGLAGATLLMGLAVWQMERLWPAAEAGTLTGLLRLSALVAVGLAVYGGAGLVLRRCLAPRG